VRRFAPSSSLIAMCTAPSSHRLRSIYNVLLDFTGGLLSIGQLLMDCAVSGDWSGIQGDPVKFGLGFTSMVADVVFMAQHYCLFRGGKAGPGARRRTSTRGSSPRARRTTTAGEGRTTAGFDDDERLDDSSDSLKPESGPAAAQEIIPSSVV